MKSKKILTSRFYRPKVGITIGDPSGIGPLITILALKSLRGIADFTVIGDAWVMKQAAKIAGYKLSLDLMDMDNVSHRRFSFGKIKAEYGRASMEYLKEASNLIKQGAFDCLVTCPISKESVNLAGFNISGHTEFFAQAFKNSWPIMMLLNRKLRFVLLTRHIPLRDVCSRLDKENIYATISLTYEFLRSIFNIKSPRMVACGVNPHASDNGLLGSEENSIIMPVIKRLAARGIFVDGPKSADTAVYEAQKNKYDCIFAMYHDQALISLKLLGNRYGVNLTLGLPFIRTSPLHGTAFDIAGSNKADPSSLTEAVKVAIRCRLNQRKN